MKKMMPMRLRVLLTILPIAIVPILVVALVTVELIRERMLNQSKVFYSNIVSQVETNIDFFYNQYALVLSDITQTDSFLSIVNRPQARSFKEQRMSTVNEDRLSVYERVRTTITARSKGDFILLETDRYDHDTKKDFILTKFSVNDIVLTDRSNFFNSSVYKVMNERMNMQPVFSISSFMGVNGYELDIRPGFFAPFLQNNAKNITKAVGIVETKDFIKDLYKKNTSLQSGTIYILDQFNNVLSRNHPDFDDYYDYDTTKKKYILNPGDPLYDSFTKMSFLEYNLLNTDSTILQNISIEKEIAENDNDEYSVKSRIIQYRGIQYLSFFIISPLSGAKIAYFHPVKQILGPIVQIVNGILIIAFIVTIGVLIISLYISRFFTKPIVDLTDAARVIKSGDYTSTVNSQKYFGEFVELGETFNSMVSQINAYNQDLERLVKQRTEELYDANSHLKTANNDLVIINDKNKKELLMAQRIQMSLIPKVFPYSDIISFSALYLPMEALGGDLYDVYTISESKFGILILDVCGHGVPAALITTMAKMSFSTNSKLFFNPDKVMESSNKDLCEAIQGSGDFLTAFYGIIDVDSMTIEYSNAGHNDMLIIHNNRDITPMGTNGPVVGVFNDMQFGCATVKLHPKDRIVLYTDGVTEAMNCEKSLYMTERLIGIIKQNTNKSSKEFTQILFNDIMTFKANVPHNDDIAVIVTDVI